MLSQWSCLIYVLCWIDCDRSLWDPNKQDIMCHTGGGEERFTNAYSSHFSASNTIHYVHLNVLASLCVFYGFCFNVLTQPLSFTISQMRFIMLLLLAYDAIVHIFSDANCVWFGVWQPAFMQRSDLVDKPLVSLLSYYRPYTVVPFNCAHYEHRRRLIAFLLLFTYVQLPSISYCTNCNGLRIFRFNKVCGMWLSDFHLS